jgi:radical SAM protein with 4Fe4S-binding SPASM domain
VIKEVLERTGKERLVEKSTLFLGSDNTVLRRIDDFNVILNPDLPNIMVADEFGRRIFECCKNKQSAGEIIGKVSDEFGLDRNEVQGYVDSLIKAGFLSTTPPAFPKLKRSSNVVRSLVLHVTEECNLRCKHCYFAATDPQEKELSLKEFLSVIKQFADLGGESLLITGGEPLLQKQKLRAIIKEARTRKINRILVNTNGTLITDEDAAFFKENVVNVGVSIDGATVETHEFIRGKGSYGKALNGIRALRRARINVVIGTTLMKPNLHEAPDVIRLAKRIDVPTVDFVILKPKGRAKVNQSKLEFSVEDLVSTMKSILETSKETGVKTSFEELQTSTRTFTRRDLCGAGLGLLGLAANGDVYPCDALHDEHLKAGNIRKETLSYIWRNSQVLRAFQEMSVVSTEGCKDCEYKFICGNGCPADTYITYGNFSKCSPFCPMYKEIFNYMITHIARDLWKEISVEA